MAPCSPFSRRLVLALITNLEMLRRTYRGGLMTTGPWVSHIAFCLVMIGVVITSYFSQQQALSVPGPAGGGPSAGPSSTSGCTKPRRTRTTTAG